MSSEDLKEEISGLKQLLDDGILEGDEVASAYTKLAVLTSELAKVEQEEREAEAAERARQEAEAAERAKREAEAAERARQEAEAAERARQEAEAAERAKREAEPFRKESEVANKHVSHTHALRRRRVRYFLLSSFFFLLLPFLANWDDVEYFFPALFIVLVNSILFDIFTPLHRFNKMLPESKLWGLIIIQIIAVLAGVIGFNLADIYIGIQQIDLAWSLGSSLPYNIWAFVVYGIAYVSLVGAEDKA